MLLLLHTGQATLQEQRAEPGDFKKLFRRHSFLLKSIAKANDFCRAHTGSGTHATERKTI